MNQKEAIHLLEQALYRIKEHPLNYKGFGWQCGGSYWRLSKVLRLYLEPNLVKEEGREVAEGIFRSNGRIVIESPVKTTDENFKDN